MSLLTRPIALSWASNEYTLRLEFSPALITLSRILLALTFSITASEKDKSIQSFAIFSQKILVILILEKSESSASDIIFLNTKLFNFISLLIKLIASSEKESSIIIWFPGD